MQKKSGSVFKNEFLCYNLEGEQQTFKEYFQYANISYVSSFLTQNSLQFVVWKTFLTLNMILKQYSFDYLQKNIFNVAETKSKRGFVCDNFSWNNFPPDVPNGSSIVLFFYLIGPVSSVWTLHESQILWN